MLRVQIWGSAEQRGAEPAGTRAVRAKPVQGSSTPGLTEFLPAPCR